MSGCKATVYRYKDSFFMALTAKRLTVGCSMRASAKERSQTEMS